MRGVARDNGFNSSKKGFKDFMSTLKDDVTLIAIDTINAARARRVLRLCAATLPFTHIKFITSLPGNGSWYTPIPYETLNGSMILNAYSDFCIRHLWKYFDTSHCLIVQHDGWIENPAAWRDEWLEWDYIGCVADWSSPGAGGKGGCGGFSLRSRRLMELAARIATKTHEEDIVLSHAKPRGQRDDFEAAGMRFAPNSVQELWGYDAQTWRGEFGHHRAINLGNYPERCKQIV
jgi:hypothetical protein